MGVGEVDRRQPPLPRCSDGDFVDSDAQVEARTGRTVREIFEDDGEPAFRVLETEALRDALDAPGPTIVAAAGGVVLTEENRRLLERPNVEVVWLRADPTILVERAVSGDHRPLLAHDPRGRPGADGGRP